MTERVKLCPQANMNLLSLMSIYSHYIIVIIVLNDSDPSVVFIPHTQQAEMHCMFWHLSIMANCQQPPGDFNVVAVVVYCNFLSHTCSF